MNQRTTPIFMALVFFGGSFLPHLALARANSRKLAKEDVAIRKDMVPVTTYVQPNRPASGIAANSYVPAPVPTTQYVYMPPATTTPNPMLAMAPALISSLMGLLKGTSGATNSKSAAADPTVGMTDEQISQRAYSTAAPDSIADLNASSHNDDAEVAVPGASPSRRMSPSGNLHSMKKDAQTSAGQCLATVKNVGDAKRILVRNGIQVGKETNDRQLVSLAMGIQQIELLYGGPSPYVRGATFRFLKNSSYSAQRPGAIYMGANHQDGNVNHLMHELGHFAGNNGLYAGYKKLGKCNLSQYSHKDWAPATARNEEFAEVFSAFIGAPQRLRDSTDENCREAFRYLSSKFPNAQRYAICDRNTLMAAVGNGGAVQTASLERRNATAQNAVQ